MSLGEPTVTCMKCKRRRCCDPHRRANEPAKAARKWLQRRCPKKLENCDIRYTAGILLGGRIAGQHLNPELRKLNPELRKLIYG